MPGFDRSGPQERGPMTGGMRGQCCSGVEYAGGFTYNRGFGRGFGTGRGMRRGFSPGWYPQSTAAQVYPLNEANEVNMLKAQASDMQSALDEIKSRITELEKSSE